MKNDNRDMSAKPAMPDDAVLVKQTGPLEFYFSQSEHIFLVVISGCQAGPIRLSRPEIIGLLNIFDQKTQDKESTLLAELECDEDDF
ncbi:MAG: hypothetical protein WA610_11185 [Thermodesulfovibrionales bacterium]